MAAVLAAAASVPRLAILAELGGGEAHVSELARRVGMSRALLYMHLSKLEAAGYVESELTLGSDGTALKVVRLKDFAITLTPSIVNSLDPAPVPAADNE